MRAESNNHFFFRNEELPTGEIVDVIFAPNPRNSCNECIRPVNAVFNKAGHLIVTADATNEIFRVAYNAQLPIITQIDGEPAPKPAPSASNKPFLTTISMFVVMVGVLMNW